MNIDTQRWIDRRLGAPLCFALTLFDALFKRKPSKQPLRNVLIVQLSEMGSLALAYPSIRELRAMWPKARVHFLVFKRNRSFLELLDLAAPEDIWTLDDSSGVSFMCSVWRFFRTARKRGIDAVLDYEIFSRASMILSYLSGAGKRAGFDNYLAEGLYRGRLLTHRVFYNVYKHISLNFVAMVRALAADPREQPCLKQVVQAGLSLPKLPASPERTQAMRDRVRRACPILTDRTRLIVLSPFSGNLLPLRAWPTQHYVALILGLLERTSDTAILVIGLPEAREYCRPLFEQAGSPRLVDFIGQTEDIAEVVDLFHISDLFVTADSGPPHFASLTDIPTIVMFGPESPAMYAPLGQNVRTVFLGMSCSPCVSAFNHRDTPCRINRCMMEIEPRRILEMALEALAGNR